MKMLKRYIPVFSLLFVISSCEKSVQFKLDDVTPKLVVEGSIENGQPPVIYLSRSLDFYSKIDQAVLQSSFVHNAVVTVSNGTKTHQLKEYTIPVGGGYSVNYYSIDSSNLATAFTGELNKTYTLHITESGKDYTAVTHIPNITRRIDSLYWKQAPIGNPDEKVSVMLKAYDPPGFGDYIRYFTKRNQELFLPGLNSVYDDQIIDGTSYEIQIERAISRNVSASEGFSFFDKGDTVTLKLSNIDKATYDFWRTMEFTYSSVGNPFASPTKVMSNLQGGALGYFGGYASQYKTLIIPR